MRRKPRTLTSNLDWKRWGRVDPLWGALAWTGKDLGTQPWSDEAFYEVGRSDWADFARQWERYGVANESCVEIGCGAGRITSQLVNYFETVHALDVSEAMLNYARPRIPGASFYLTDGTRIPLNDNVVTAAFSCHVLQHLDSPREAVSIFLDVFRVLKPAGTMMIHLPIYRWPFDKGSFESRLLERSFGVRQWIAQQKSSAERRVGRLMMRGTWYQFDWLVRVLGEVGFVDIEFSTFRVTSNGDFHPFVFGRKASASSSIVRLGTDR
jgi:SAM-dependent methyltransferase